MAQIKKKTLILSPIPVVYIPWNTEMKLNLEIKILLTSKHKNIYRLHSKKTIEVILV